MQTTKIDFKKLLGRTIRKLMGGGGRAKYKKINSRKGKFNLKKFLHAN